MHRREVLRQLFSGRRTSPVLSDRHSLENRRVEKGESYRPDCFKSRWHVASDVPFTELGILPQPLENWCIRQGELQCMANEHECMAQVLTHQLAEENKGFTANLVFRFLNGAIAASSKTIFAGMRFGLKENVGNDSTAGISCNGINVGITRSGYLFIGEKTGDRKLDGNVLTENLRLSFSIVPQAAGGSFAKLKVLDQSGNTVATLASAAHDATAWQGGIALVSYSEATAERTHVAISTFEIEGGKVTAAFVPARETA